jgi:hypothetical protein
MTWDPADGERRRTERKSRAVIEQWLRDFHTSARGFTDEEVGASRERGSVALWQRASDAKKPERGR